MDNYVAKYVVINAYLLFLLLYICYTRRIYSSILLLDNPTFFEEKRNVFLNFKFGLAQVKVINNCVDWKLIYFLETLKFYITLD